MVMSELNNKISAVATNIRDISGETAAMGFDEMSAELEKVKTEIALQDELIEEAAAALEGKIGGYKEAYDRGYEEGSAFYNDYWDTYQENGNRTNYNTAFSGSYWTEKTFKPKYDIKPTSMKDIFSSKTLPLDISKHLHECGVVLDTSKCTNFETIMYHNEIQRIPPLNMESATTVHRMFEYSFGVNNVELFNIKPNYTWGRAFGRCDKLTDLYMYGEIGMGLTHTGAALTADSAKTVLLALKDYSGTDEDFAYSVTFHAGTWTNLDALGATSPNGNTWKEYADDKGWNT